MIADDENVTITVDAVKADSAGDPGYVMHIVNKTPGKVYVYAGQGWKARGVTVGDAVLRASVDAGQAAEVFAWFDRRDYGMGSLDGLKGVEGTIVVESFDTGARVGEYAFRM